MWFLNSSWLFPFKANCTKSSEACAMASGALTGALPGSKLDGCEAKCCYTDKCNTKDIVKLPTKQPPTKMGPSAMAAYTGASIATSIVSLLAGLAVSFY